MLDRLVALCDGQTHVVSYIIMNYLVQIGKIKCGNVSLTNKLGQFR